MKMKKTLKLVQAFVFPVYVSLFQNSSTNEMRGFFLDHLFSTKSDISVMSFEK